MLETISPRGLVIVRVFDKDGILKMESVNHNIITNQGDSLIADALANTPARQKFNASNGYVVVGTGYTGTSIKTNSWVNTQVGNAQAITAGYPQLQGTWGNAGSNQLNFLFTFTAGSLNFSGINEAALVTAASQGGSTSCLAYALVSPSVNVTLSDSLQVIWQISFLGS